MRAGLLVLLLVLLTACQGNYAPVRDSTEAIPASGKHVVKQGETLYAIAWRYQKDYRQVAKLNHISPPYTIYPGQSIRLIENTQNAAPSASQEPVVVAAAPHSSFVPEQDAGWVQMQTDTPIQEVVVTTAVPQQEVILTEEIILSSEGTTSEVIVASSSKLLKPKMSPAAGKSKWIWPANGKLLRGFSKQNKGFDIQGKKGDPIYASAAGEVVYSGTGLRGYGQLVIIKHNEDYLSAYAHNDTILVREGQRVKQGEQIAEMGNTGSHVVKLHFELRYRGEPVDPAAYLQAR